MTTAPSPPGPVSRVRPRVYRRAVFAVLGVTSMMLLPSFALAQGVGEWTQFQGGPGHTGGIPGGPEPAYRLDWSLPVDPSGPGDQYGISAPVVAGDTIVVVGPEQVFGVDAASGERTWAVDRDLGPPVPAAIATIDGSEAVVYTEGFGDGPPDPDATASPPSSPASASGSPSEGDEAAGGGEAFDSHLAAFDLRTREPLFKPVPLDAVSRGGVTIDGSMAFVAANGGRVVAVDLADGSIAWHAELGRPLLSPPTVAAGVVLVGMQATQTSRLPTVVALDAADGEENWRLDDQGAAAIVSTAAADATTAYVAFSGSQEASIDAIEIATGERMWRARLPRLLDPSATAPPVITSDAVYATDALGVTYALDPTDGSELWEFALDQNVFRAAPIAVTGHVLVGTVDGDLAAIEASSGELVWRSEDSESPIRAMAVAGERIVIVRAGVDIGLQAYVHDPEAALIREDSPTTPNPGVLALNAGLAGVAVVGLTLLLGRFLAGRAGLALPGDDESRADPGDGADPAEPADPDGDEQDLP